MVFGINAFAIIIPISNIVFDPLSWRIPINFQKKLIIVIQNLINRF